MLSKRFGIVPHGWIGGEGMQRVDVQDEQYFLLFGEPHSCQAMQRDQFFHHSKLNSVTVRGFLLLRFSPATSNEILCPFLFLFTRKLTAEETPNWE